MGGAIAIHTASLGYIKNLVALIVIDVVEGMHLCSLNLRLIFINNMISVGFKLEDKFY